MAPSIQVGDTLPPVSFGYIPYTPELESNFACGVPSKLTSESLKGKKVVLFSVPGAFTPTCHINHLPPYIQNYDKLKAKGVDIIAVLASNDLWVMSGWGRFEGVKDKILCLSDADAKWSESLGLAIGTRTARYALIIDDLIVKYVGVESAPGVTVSGAEAILEALDSLYKL